VPLLQDDDVMATDDHGTLRDKRGQLKVYRAIASSEGPSVPLAEAAIWPDDMTDWEAERYAADTEFGRARPGPWMGVPILRRRWRYPALRGLLSLVACAENHDGERCPSCGAER
jgi:hypothetical protein